MRKGVHLRRIGRRGLLAVIMVVSVAVPLWSAAAPASGAVAARGRTLAEPWSYLFEIRRRFPAPEKCVDVDNGYTFDGANVKQWECVNVPQQHWQFQRVAPGSEWFFLRAQHSGKCLDVDNGYTFDGANVKQWECVNVPQQMWRWKYAYTDAWWNTFYFLENQKSGKCLDVDHGWTHNGANIQQWTCDEYAGQQLWYFRQV
ncbi:RICIN domain-containing protein [Nonomuraea sp. NPDC049637]|uniref:RICIN domain-containing protein n=1 Tax=unclassified Nonomuraea TaxID=2593643 RepID=UPI003448EF60